MRLPNKVRKHAIYKSLKLFAKRIVGREPRCNRDVRVDFVIYEDWPICIDRLGDDSVVYSVGVGEAVTFELEIIERCRLAVHAFDSTPSALRWVERQDLPSRFLFHPWAIAPEDGVLRMSRRIDERGKTSRVNWTTVQLGAEEPDTIEVRCHSLPSVMETLGHERIDLLKMDVEGLEYDLLASLMQTPHRPTQLLVEFHHRFETIGIDKSRDCIDRLRAVGYGLFAVSRTGREFGFVHEPVAG